MKVYIVWHEDSCDELEVIIGIYSTVEAANKVIERLQKEYPVDSIWIQAFPLDE